MKKILVVLFALIVAVCSFAACDKAETGKEGNDGVVIEEGGESGDNGGQDGNTQGKVVQPIGEAGDGTYIFN